MQIFKEPKEQSVYFANIASIPQILTLGSVIAAFLLAYYVPAATPNFNQQVSAFNTQPQVEFTGKWQYLLQNSNGSFMYTTNTALQTSSMTAGALSTQPSADNNIGFTLNLPVTPSQGILQVALEFNYKMNSVVPLQMKSLAVFEVILLPNTASCQVQGDLMWYQSKPLPPPYTQLDQRYDPTVASTRLVYDNSIIDSLGSVDFQMSSYNDRTEKTWLMYQSSQTLDNTATSIQINGKIRFPSQSVTYRQGIAEQMKQTFVQYFVFLLTFGLLALVFHQMVVLNMPGVYVKQGPLTYKF